MFKKVAKYGFFNAILFQIIFVISEFLGEIPFLDLKQLFADILLFAVFIGFACREYKQLHNKGFLHFWEGMTIGFFVYSVAIVLFGVFLLVLLNWNADYLEEYKAAASAYYESRQSEFVNDFGESTYNKALREVNHATVNKLVAGGLMKKFFAALLVTPVVSVILRKKPE